MYAYYNFHNSYGTRSVPITSPFGLQPFFLRAAGICGNIVLTLPTSRA